MTAREKWEAMLRAEAEEIATRENVDSSHCGAYGDDTWEDHIDYVRERFEEIGLAYMTLAESEA